MSAANQTELDESFFPTTAALWQRRLPWIRLLRGFRMAISGRRMLLALIAVLLWSAGEWVIVQLSVPPERAPTRVIWPWENGRRLPGTAVEAAEALINFPATNLETVSLQRSPHLHVTAPLTRVLAPAHRLLLAPVSTSPHLPLILLFLLGALVSAIFGGAISRMAAVDFATHGDVSVRSSLGFSLRHWAASLGAPLIALIGFGCCWLFNFFAGLVANLPVVGELLVAVCWGLLILAGFAMAFILLVTSVGWPLMVAAVSTESGDAFDALSRACSYILNRPWYALFLSLLALLYGAALVMFVGWMVDFTARMTVIPYAAGLMDDPSVMRPSLNEVTASPWGTPPGTLYQDTGRNGLEITIRTFWMRILASIPTAFVFSYFWTIVTLIYFLLRKREDATPLDEVWLPASSNELQMPLVGIPAAELREQKLRTANPPAPDHPAGEA